VKTFAKRNHKPVQSDDSPQNCLPTEKRAAAEDRRRKPKEEISPKPEL
jgi:hypothetical protein